MEVMLLGRVTLVRPLQSMNARSPILVTGRLLIVAGITKSPVALGLEPVMVMVFPSLENNNSAFSEAEEKRRRERKQAEQFLRKGNIFIFRAQL